MCTSRARASIKILMINSVSFPGMGWLSGEQNYETFRRLLGRSGIEVEKVEVTTAQEVRQVLRLIPDPDVLIWPNAYDVAAGTNDPSAVDLVGLIEDEGRPFVGSSSATLSTVMDKGVCQSKLAAAGIPIPRFTIATSASPIFLNALLEETGLGFPLVVKPPCTSASVGVSLARSLEQLSRQVGELIEQYGPRVMIEQYLIGSDLTVAVFPRADRCFLLPTWYEVDGQGHGPKILDRAKRLKPWGRNKRMRLVTHPNVLYQIKAILPHIVDLLNVRDVTRIDGRLDEQGVLNIFDVNGMPGLECPASLTVQQLRPIWPEADGRDSLEKLLCTLLASAAERYDLPLPDEVVSKSFFGDGSRFPRGVLSVGRRPRSTVEPSLDQGSALVPRNASSLVVEPERAGAAP